MCAGWLSNRLTACRLHTSAIRESNSCSRGNHIRELFIVISAALTLVYFPLAVLPVMVLPLYAYEASVSSMDFAPRHPLIVYSDHCSFYQPGGYPHAVINVAQHLRHLRPSAIRELFIVSASELIPAV